MKYKSVCIVGIDGTGKSSAVKNLQKKIGKGKAVIQYMGAKQWESNLGVKYFVKKNYKGPLKPLIWVVSYIYEMYYRYYKHQSEGKIVIFDRYAYEHALFRDNVERGFKGIIFNFIFKCAFLWFYPNPNKTFYLFCPLDVSLGRKSDITTEEEISNLKRNKLILDNFYKKRKDVILIDTTKINEDQVVTSIMNELKAIL